MVRNPNDMNTFTEPVEPLGYREYETIEEIQPGDIVVMRQNLGNPGCCAFMTSIVEKIEKIEGHPHSLVYMARPHAKVDVAGHRPRLGTAYVAMESYPVEDYLVIERFVRFTNGGAKREPDRRAY